MVAMAPAAGLVLASLAVVLATSLWTAAVHLVWRPYAVARAFRRQGIRGPAYRFFVGNNEEAMAMRAATADDVLDLRSHDIIARVMPHYKAWVASEEVLRECGSTGTPLHGDTLNKLKLTTMVLYETLRLYGAVIMIARQTMADTELGGVEIPKGTITMIPTAMMHRDEEVWGADAGEFKPDRFRNGVGRAAKHPSAMLAFAVGPRSCIGQDFAMLEAKATLVVILRRFEFEVAPEDVHAPAEFLTLQPKCGLPVLLKLLDQ
uniref:Secologanin synthase n=1 Tax=Aegilops tauschii TaxID=37682 RepID=M8AXJ6_AEGTA